MENLGLVVLMVLFFLTLTILAEAVMYAQKNWSSNARRMKRIKRITKSAYF